MTELDILGNFQEVDDEVIAAVSELIEMAPELKSLDMQLKKLTAA